MKVVHRATEMDKNTVQCFLRIDPLKHKFPSWSPYSYGFCNPIRFNDPTGMEPEEGDPKKSRSYSDMNILEKGLYNMVKGVHDLGQKLNEAGGDKSNFNSNITRGAGFITGHIMLIQATAEMVNVSNMKGRGPLKEAQGATAKSETTVYRVFGGDARAEGFSWTTTNPTSVKQFRNLAGLPSGGASGATNTADFMIKGQANFNDIIKSRTALPLDGNIGGLPELIIAPKNVRITDFKVLKP